MAIPKDTLWKIELHTIAKHEILCRYLGAWFAILGRSFPLVNYIDGFAGPGRYTNGEEGSPIHALNIAIGHKAASNFKDMNFTFVEERKDRADHLRSEIDSLDNIPSNFHIRIEEDQFENVLMSILDELDKKGEGIAPTFAFVDPFGFKGASYSVIKRLLSNESTEVFINFMADSINRWVTTPDQETQQRIIELFGTEEVIEIIKNSSNRIESLRLLYQEQLQKTAKFVRFFQMYDTNDRLIYFLFFASNNQLGHKKMKEVFWKVDPSTGFKFSDATNPNQPPLFKMDPSLDLSDLLIKRFNGQTVLCIEIRIYVEDETAYLKKHMDEALKLLEGKGKISPKEQKQDGNPRRANNFHDDVIVKFNN